jgi:hypothetical protein
MTAKECPNCRLPSPGTATVCACGWDFETGAMRVPRPMAPRPPRVLPASVPGAGVGPAAADLAPLWQRVFLMPFVPSLWTRAAGWRFADVAVPVALLCLLLAGAFSAYRSLDFGAELTRTLQGYDESYPAVVVEGGKVRVEGDAVIRWADRKSTFLVDPRETVALESITTPEYIVVRETQVIRKQRFRTQVSEVAEVQALLGDPLRIDSKSLRAFDARWGGWIQVGLAAGMAALMVIGNALGLAYVAAAAGLALALRGRASGLGYAACFRAALAPYGLVPVIATAANLAGHSVGFCVGVWLWPLLLGGLATWAVARARG